MIGSHWTPRSRTGKMFVLLFLLLMALVQPPIVFGWPNRMDPWILGVPFLYAYLSLVYTALIGVLILAAWKLPR